MNSKDVFVVIVFSIIGIIVGGMFLFCANGASQAHDPDRQLDLMQRCIRAHQIEGASALRIDDATLNYCETFAARNSLIPPVQHGR